MILFNQISMFSKPAFVLTLCVSLIIPSPTIAQPEPTEDKITLKVGVAGSPPFVNQTNDIFKGISVEIWQELAEAEQLDYELIRQPGVKAGIDRVANGELDVLIGPVSITADRFERVTFTQPYFTANIGLLISGENPTVWSRIRPLFRLAVISSVGGLFLVLFIVGNLIWFAEHRRNDQQFPKEYVRGVGSGMWFALVTLTTVGYGDKAPVTKTGKAITSLWMLITMVAASSLTAGIATVLTLLLSKETVEPFAKVEDIKNKQIAIITGTTGEQWAKSYQARLLQSSGLEEAIYRLKSGQAKGVLFDVPALKYYLYQHPEVPFQLANISVAVEDYGFVLPLESELVNDINVSLIELKESGRLKEIIEREIQGKKQTDNQVTQLKIGF